MRERKNQAALRRECFERDRGVCKLCGVDTIALFEEYYPLLPMLPEEILEAQVSRRLMPKSDETCLRLLGALQYQFVERVLDVTKLILNRGKLRQKHPWIRQVTYASGCWEMDHIIPLVEGGGNSIDDVRTLCVQCHRQETAALKSRLARNPKKKYVARRNA